MNYKKFWRRWLYIAISLIGIGYELFWQENSRLFVIAGYAFIIMVTFYSLWAQRFETEG